MEIVKAEPTDVELAHNEDAVAFYKRYGFRIGVFRMEK